jgi:spore maturation protein CgeB
MRWLVVGSPHPDSFAENIVVTLRDMGYEAMAPPWPSPFPRLKNIRGIASEIAGRLGVDVLAPIARWAIKTAREWRPDIVIAPTLQLGDATLLELRRRGACTLVAWWGDTPANMARLGLASSAWDLILFKDRATVKKYRMLGLNAHLMHEAMNPMWHKPMACAVRDHLSVAGNWYGYRQSLVQTIVRRGQSVAMYGPPPPRWSVPEVQMGHTGRYLVKKEKSVAFGEALACLNSFSVAEGDSLNCRAFETAGAGGLQLIEDRPSISGCFDPGTEILPFSGIDELFEYLARARREPNWAASVRAAGAKRALAEHTYRHRLNSILRLAGLV